jgi:hypothetical protein
MKFPRIEEKIKELENDIKINWGVNDRKKDFLKELKEAINFTDSSTQLSNKKEIDFDVWVINKGYTKCEGEFIKGNNVYSLEDVQLTYCEDVDSL